VFSIPGAGTSQLRKKMHRMADAVRWVGMDRSLICGLVRR
jgi:hypothetical protein